MPKMKLNYHDQSDRVRSIPINIHKDNVTDHIGVVYAKNRTDYYSKSVIL